MLKFVGRLFQIQCEQDSTTMAQPPSSHPLLHVLIHEKERDIWRMESMSLAALFRIESQLTTYVVFASSKLFLDEKGGRFRDALSSHFKIPQVFWCKTCVEHNGFFGSSTVPYSGSSLSSHDTWFRFIVKQLLPAGYRWDEMSFYSHWEPNKNVLICFDTPDSVCIEFKKALESEHELNSFDLSTPFSLHTVLLQCLIEEFNKSIWSISMTVRNVEKIRNKLTNPEQFPTLHDLSRHTTHSTETTQVAADMIERMVRQCGRLAKLESVHKEALNRRLEMLDFQHSMVKSLVARSISNEKRLSSEINLVFNMMAQKSNQINLEIARASKIDSAAMKTIAIVTLTFLPATFISALFSMTFFDPTGGSLTVSDDIWIYFVISVPLTVVLVLFWWKWQQQLVKIPVISGDNEDSPLAPKHVLSWQQEA